MPQRGNVLRPIQLDRCGHFVGARIDHADRIVEPVGNKQSVPVLADCQPARIQPHFDARHNIIRARGEILHKTCGVSMNVKQQSRNVDHGYDLRPAACHINLRFIRGDRHTERLRGVTLQLIQRHLHCLTNVCTEYRNRVFECSAVFQVRQRHKILGMVLSDDAQPAIRGKCCMKHTGNCMKRHAIHHHRTLHIYDGNFRLRCGPIR